MPKLIRTWEELAKETSENYYLDVDLFYGKAWIRPKDHLNIPKEDYYKHNTYLSTHTFYEGYNKGSTKLLQQYGFDVELESWG